MPIDSTVAEFMKVAVMPAPAPRWSAGTLFMISARFGAMNVPDPMPKANSSTANCQ
jgi:hypothetical protein